MVFSPMSYLLDTHVWIWWHMMPERLSARARELIARTQAYEEMLLSAISPWEFCKLLEKNRLGIEGSPEAWMEAALRMPKLRLVPLTPQIAYKSTTLPQPFNRDPADQIIVATARELGATVISADDSIRRYEHVRAIW